MTKKYEFNYNARVSVIFCCSFFSFFPALKITQRNYGTFRWSLKSRRPEIKELRRGQCN